MRRTYHGQCHCGTVRFEVEADLEGEPSLLCNCTNCTMKGFIHHHVEKARFTLLSRFDDLKLYKFGTLSAEHYFCTSCGVESFYRSRSDPDKWDINVRCLRHADTGKGVDIYALDYFLVDGANWEEAHAARDARDARERRSGVKHQAKRWRLIAPADALDPSLNVAGEFRKSWSDDDAPEQRKRKRP